MGDGSHKSILFLATQDHAMLNRNSSRMLKRSPLSRLWLYTRPFILLGLAALLFFLGGLILWASLLPLPSLEIIAENRLSNSTKIYDRTGDVLLFDLHQNVKRISVPIEKMSPYVKNATIAVEDGSFYHHFGINPLAIARAIWTNLTQGRLLSGQGGSTITQQVVKNALLVKDKTVSRKIKEWILAMRLERAATKDEILTLYLNSVPYGGTHYGVEEASQSFFGKSAADLTLAESAYLASLPQLPTYYSPYGPHRDALEIRKNYVLDRMYTLNLISAEERDEAKQEKVAFRPQEGGGVKAPHFVFYVLEELEATYGKEALEERGFRVITTLDWELQKKAEGIVRQYALQNEQTFNASNAALMAVDPTNGEELVMVGSRDYFDEKVDGAYNATLALRQPGSSFKPFVYAAAFAKGYTPETVVFDLPTQFSTACAIGDLSSEPPCYAPHNYDEKFRGPITFRNALAQSVNIPAVKALYLVGLQSAIDTARSLGITTLGDPDRYGLSLVLGGGEVRLLDITSAYGVFAREGVRHPAHAIERIEDNEGNTIFSHEDTPIEVLSAQVAREISSVLSDNDARAPAFGPESALHFPGHDVAVKTGTTNEYRDAWIIGYTPMISVGAWAGNSDNTPMEKKVAGFIVAPMWNEFMQAVLADQRFSGYFTPPDPVDPTLKPVLRGMWRGSKTYERDSASGGVATENTPLETRETVVIPSVHNILHWVEKENPQGSIPSNPWRDSQYAYWEAPVHAWALAQGLESAGGTEEMVGAMLTDDVHSNSQSPMVTITSPTTGITYNGDHRLNIAVNVEHSFPIQTVVYRIDGREISRAFGLPVSVPIVPRVYGISSGTHTLDVEVTDSVHNRGSASVLFIVQ